MKIYNEETPIASASSSDGFKTNIIAAIAFVSGLLGAIIHGIISAESASMPIIKNQFSSVWFSLILCVQGLQFQYTSHQTEYLKQNMRARLATYVYFALFFLLSIISFICYCVIGDVGAILWNVCLIFFNGYVLYFLATTCKETGIPSNPRKGYIVGMNTCFRILLTCITTLLAVGGITTAYAYSYTYTGNIVSASLTDGRTALFHYYCQGPKNVSLPVLWFVADAAHGVVDYYGPQGVLAAQGRRVCSYDNAGFAWSSDLMANESNELLYLDGIITASGEGFPIILLGNGGGGSAILSYQSTYPSKVSALVFLSVYPAGIEFDFYQNQTGITDAAKFTYRAQQMQSRLSLSNIILALAIPWGLMPLFDPVSSVPPGFLPANKITEYKVQSWKSNLWVNQYGGLLTIAATPDALDSTNTLTLPSALPFYHIFCNLNRYRLPRQSVETISDFNVTIIFFSTQVCSTVATGGYQLSSSDCATAVLQNSYYFYRQQQMTYRIQANANIIYNYDTLCNIQFPTALPGETATSVMSAISWIRN